MPTITKSGSKVTVGATEYEEVNVPEKSFDLQDYKGERIRVHIGNDYKYTIETRPKQKLLICELDIPKREYVHTKTAEKDEKGEYIIETKEKELDLSKVEMKEYPKEVEMKTK